MNDDFYEFLVGRGLRKSTARRYESDLRKMEAWIEKPVESWGEHDFNKLCMHLRGQIPGKLIGDKPDNYGVGTFRNYINTLDLYAKIFKLRGMKKMTEDVKDNLKYKPKKPKPIIAEVDVAKFLDAVWRYDLDEEMESPYLQIRARFMVVFGYFFNCRISEIPIVRVEDVNEAVKEVIIEDVKGIGGKFYEPCGSHLFWKYYQLYMKERPEGAYLFSTRGGHKIGVDTVYNSFRLFTPILRKFGVEYVNMTPHLTRRSRITANSAKLSLREGMYLSRHASSAAYDKYNKMGMDDDTRKKLKGVV